MKTGKLIEKLRKERKLTRWTLAKELGITENYVMYIERREKLPSPELLIRIGLFFYSLDILGKVYMEEQYDRVNKKFSKILKVIEE